MTRKRALLISYPFPPAASGGVFRILRFCKYLPDFGWEPIVLTPKPDSVVPITLDPSLDELIPHGLEVHRTKVLRPFHHAKSHAQRVIRFIRSQDRNTGATVALPSIASVDSAPGGLPAKGPVDASDEPRGALKQFLRTWEGLLLANPDRHVGWFLPAVLEGLRIIRRKRPTIIYATGPPHSVHLIAVALKRLTGVPMVLDFRDPWAAKEWSTSARATAKQRSAASWEARCVAAADRIVLNTDPVCRQFEESYGPGKFIAIPNGLDVHFAERVESLLHATHSPDDEIRLCHAGSVYGKRDLRPLAAAIEIVAGTGRRISMEQIGSVDEGRRPPLSPDGRNGSLHLLGARPHEETLARMAAASILVLIQPDNRLQIPGKLYEMLPFRKPMLTLANSGATADVVRRYNLGPVVDASNPSAIAEGILHASSIEGRSEVEVGMRAAMADFDGRALTGRLSAVFEAASSP